MANPFSHPNDDILSKILHGLNNKNSEDDEKQPQMTVPQALVSALLPLPPPQNQPKQSKSGAAHSHIVNFVSLAATKHIAEIITNASSASSLRQQRGNVYKEEEEEQIEKEDVIVALK